MKICNDNKAGRPKGTSTGGARHITTDEIKRLKAAALASRYPARNHALVSMLVGCGARVSEPLTLTVAEIAPDGFVLPLLSLDKHRTKSRRSRHLHFSNSAIKSIQAFLDERFANAEDPEAVMSEPLFPSRVGIRTTPDGKTRFRYFSNAKPMSANYASQLILKLMSEAGIHNASAHSLRATFATALAKKGTGVAQISALLGHANISTTHAYLKATDADLGEAVGALPF